MVQGFRVPTRPDWVGSVGLIDQVGFGSGGLLDQVGLVQGFRVPLRPGWFGSGFNGLISRYGLELQPMFVVNDSMFHGAEASLNPSFHKTKSIDSVRSSKHSERSIQSHWVTATSR